MNEHYHRIGHGGRRYWGRSGAGIIFTDGNKILLLKRSDGSKDEDGKWGIPGGKTEPGESPIETAHRECREEAGSVMGQRFAHFEERDGHHRFTVFLYAVDKPFNVKLSNEHDSFEWIPLSELHNYDLHGKFREGLPYYVSAINRRYNKNLRFSEWISLKRLDNPEKPDTLYRGLED